MSLERIARECNCSLRAVRRWIRRHEQTGGVDEKPRTGRNPALTPDQAECALEQLVSGHFHGAAHVATHLKQARVTSCTLHKSTIIRNANKAARSRGDRLKVRRGRHPKGLSSKTIAKRLAFALDHASYPWDLVMFTDRKRFYFKYPGTCVRMVRWLLESSENGSQDGVYQPNNPNCFNVYVGITRVGATEVHEVAGSTGYKHNHVNGKGQKAKNITKGQYEDVVAKTFLPAGARLFDRTRWLLQQDNDPTHRVASGVVADWNRRHGTAVQMVEGWPPSSPDLGLLLSKEPTLLGAKRLRSSRTVSRGW
jgi:transposase